MEKLLKNNTGRSPNLQTVFMVEKFIDKNSGEFKLRDLWKNLPKKVMWQTFQIIMAYLQSINKIAFDKEGFVVYIWNPELYNLVKNKKPINL